MPYSRSREGLNLYVEQSSFGERWYIYSQLIFHCWAVMPCFDQPDLKAIFKLVVLTHPDWIAVSNAPEKQEFLYHLSKPNDPSPSQKNSNEREQFISGIDASWMLDHFLQDEGVKVVEFEQTEPLPTYLYTINAGQFVEHRHKSLYADSPPQRVFQRQSSSKRKELHLICVLVEKTIKYYENELFGMKFPFRKLDHVICPDVRYAAMESAGCITYSEMNLTSKSLDTWSNSERIFFHMVVQHELAHQWFGNMVTMKWWDNIWLNESFASLIGYIACEKVKITPEDMQQAQEAELAKNKKQINYQIDAEDVWLAFSYEKQSSLVDDCMPSTHPIEAPCKDNEVAQSLLDGITYGKGAVFLNQLINTIGMQVFFDGCKLYFKKHAW